MRFNGGELIQHVLDYLRMRDYHEMMAIGDTEEQDKDDAVKNGAAVWHTTLFIQRRSNDSDHVRCYLSTKK